MLVPSHSITSLEDMLRSFLSAADFPCVGAKSALANDGVQAFEAGDLRTDDSDEALLATLQSLRLEGMTAQSFVSVAAIFHKTPRLSEEAFERFLWQRLQALHDRDAKQFAWDDAVQSDPQAPNFGMCFGGHAFYVVGLHPGASRKARRFSSAMIVFNPHLQFRKLREAGAFNRLRDVIRTRDAAYQGEVNPMVADHGERSEAPQYSGRKVARDWACPFHANRSRAGVGDDGI